VSGVRHQWLFAFCAPCKCAFTVHYIDTRLRQWVKIVSPTTLPDDDQTAPIWYRVTKQFSKKRRVEHNSNRENKRFYIALMYNTIKNLKRHYTMHKLSNFYVRSNTERYMDVARRCSGCTCTPRAEKINCRRNSLANFVSAPSGRARVDF